MSEPRQQPRVLYKYYPPADYLPKVLSGESIRFTPPSEFNDPFEFRYRVVSSADFETNLRYFAERAREYLPKASPAQRLVAAAAAARQARVGYLHEDHPSFRLLDQFWGVLCLTEVRDSMLMWAHYAKSHTGVCIGFDALKDVFFHAGAVRYSDEYPVADRGDHSEAATTAAVQTIFTKASCWSHEREWRSIKYRIEAAERAQIARDLGQGSSEARAIADQRGPGLYSFEPSSIVEVVLGCNSTITFRDQVQGWLRASVLNAPVLLAKPARGSYALEIGPCPK